MTQGCTPGVSAAFPSPPFFPRHVWTGINLEDTQRNDHRVLGESTV